MIWNTSRKLLAQNLIFRGGGGAGQPWTQIPLPQKQMPQCPHRTRQSSFLSHLGNGSFASVVPTKVPENYNIKIISIRNLYKKIYVCLFRDWESGETNSMQTTRGWDTKPILLKMMIPSCLNNFMCCGVCMWYICEYIEKKYF